MNTVVSDEGSENTSFLPAIRLAERNFPVDNRDRLNPAIAYLLSLTSPRSRTTMASFLGIVARMLGDKSIQSFNWGGIRRHHVMAIMEMLNDSERSISTINTYLSALKGVAKESWMLNLMDVESFQHIRSVRNLRGSRLPRGRALNREEIRQLFMVCENDKSSKGPRDAALLGILLGCGLRRAEVVALSMSDLIIDDGALKVLGKGNKERLSYIPSSAWQRLQVWIEHVRGEGPGPLFTRIRRFDYVTNERLSDQSVYHILQLRQQEASLATCTPHDLRRTFATFMLENGEDLMTVKDAMGHESITTTQQYDRRGNERLKKARDRFSMEN